MIRPLSDLTEAQTEHLQNLRLFTLGYQLIPADEFLEKLKSAEVDLVVDVRETAWSRKPGFSASQLFEALSAAGIEYVHAEFAGNPKELRNTASGHEECLNRYADYLDSNPSILTQLTQLMETLDDGVSICFICYERHPDDCHRSILLERWQDATGQQLNVEHLSPHGAPRFLKG